MRRARSRFRRFHSQSPPRRRGGARRARRRAGTSARASASAGGRARPWRRGRVGEVNARVRARPGPTMGLGRARLRRCRSNDSDESRKRSARVSNEALAMSISKIADGHPRSAGSPRRGPRARGSVSLRAGRAGRVDATRASFGGAARSASPRRAERKVSLFVPPKRNAEEHDFERSLVRPGKNSQDA